MGQKYRLDGRFTVKEGAEGQLSLVFEAGRGPMVILQLPASMKREEAEKIATALTPVAEVGRGFQLFAGGEIGLRLRVKALGAPTVRQTRRGVQVPWKPK
jgi:hypothetical protein